WYEETDQSCQTQRQEISSITSSKTGCKKTLQIMYQYKLILEDMSKCGGSCGCNERGDDYFDTVRKEHTEDHRTFETGAIRDSNEGKPRPDLISPYFTERLGYRLAEGAKKYGANNWQKG